LCIDLQFLAYQAGPCNPATPEAGGFSQVIQRLTPRFFAILAQCNGLEDI
jgi:hypothetical protein